MGSEDVATVDVEGEGKRGLGCCCCCCCCCCWEGGGIVPAVSRSCCCCRCSKNRLIKPSSCCCLLFICCWAAATAEGRNLSKTYWTRCSWFGWAACAVNEVRSVLTRSLWLLVVVLVVVVVVLVLGCSCSLCCCCWRACFNASWGGSVASCSARWFIPKDCSLWRFLDQASKQCFGKESKLVLEAAIAGVSGCNNSPLPPAVWLTRG